MFHEPLTSEEARKYRYRQWAGEPKGTTYDTTKCAADVPDGGRSPLSHQCNRKRGYGPNELYCCIHAKKLRHFHPTTKPN
jgi:hypothetical protein